MNIKKYKVSIYSVEVIGLLDRLPKGMRTPIIEAALNMYMKSSDGRAFMEHSTPGHPAKAKSEGKLVGATELDTLVKSRDPSLFVIPVETGIQCFKVLNPL